MNSAHTTEKQRFFSQGADTPFLATQRPTTAPRGPLLPPHALPRRLPDPPVPGSPPFTPLPEFSPLLPLLPLGPAPTPFPTPTRQLGFPQTTTSHLTSRFPHSSTCPPTPTRFPTLTKGRQLPDVWSPRGLLLPHPPAVSSPSWHVHNCRMCVTPLSPGPGHQSSLRSYCPRSHSPC